MGMLIHTMEPSPKNCHRFNSVCVAGFKKLFKVTVKKIYCWVDYFLWEDFFYIQIHRKSNSIFSLIYVHPVKNHRLTAAQIRAPIDATQSSSSRHRNVSSFRPQLRMRACCGLSCKRKREDAAKCGHHSGSVSGSRDPSLCRTKPVSIRLSHLCSFSLESERLVCGLSCLQCNNLQKPAGGVIDTHVEHIVITVAACDGF